MSVAGVVVKGIDEEVRTYAEAGRVALTRGASLRAGHM